ncbi:MAG TPA: M48 family metallopeptidase [Oxalicibacterium sp.]|nr:M48 family metallopeptidase [Oxalicibacterium sp.]
MAVPGLYFDGRTSRAHRVQLSVEAGIAQLSGDIARSCPLAELHVSEPAQHVARKVTFPDEAYFEVQDGAAFDALLQETGYRDSSVVRMQRSVRGILFGVAATVAVLVLGYLYVLPFAADTIARHLPASVERTISKGTLEFLDKHILAPSRLTATQQNAIAEQFRMLRPPQEGAPSYEIIFRSSRIGPNAFALPSGQIVLTDELVKLMDNDDEVMSVLAHELGHLHERHLMRRLVQSSAVGAVVTLLFGDVSAVIANIPTVLLDMKYSRDAERDADDYAIAMMKANGIPLSRMAEAFEQLKSKKGDADMPYLSTHPTTTERVAHIRQAQ